VLHNQGNSNYDLDGDGQTNRADSDYEVQTIFGTRYGDANLDRRINALDFNEVATNYGSAGGWANGDFNGDGVVNSLDSTCWRAISDSQGKPQRPRSALSSRSPDGLERRHRFFSEDAAVIRSCDACVASVTRGGKKGSRPFLTR